MPDSRTAVLELIGVEKTYCPAGRAAVSALSGVDLCLQSGDLQVIAGPSGSGKSTLLLCAGGLLHPSSGQILVQGTDLYGLSSEQRSQWRARHIGFVFQQFHLIPFLDIYDNILVGALPGGAVPALRSRAEMLVERFGLLDRCRHPVTELSVGERQRVALARALLFQPALLLADEPTGNLDDENAGVVLQALQDFSAEGGAVLLVTHNRQLVNPHTRHLINGRFAAAPAPMPAV
jgi:ABC-type lipoprotein export system ATPase subunit